MHVKREVTMKSGLPRAICARKADLRYLTAAIYEKFAPQVYESENMIKNKSDDEIIPYLVDNL